MDRVLGRLGFDPRSYAVFDAWDREVRPIMKSAEAVALQGARLCVRVPSAVHRQELSISKDRLIKRINQAMGGQILKDIRFELAAGASRSASAGTTPIKKEGERRGKNRAGNGRFGNHD